MGFDKIYYNGNKAFNSVKTCRINCSHTAQGLMRTVL